jgi:hypothetical protein
VEVEAKLPPGCFGGWDGDWPDLGARALVGGAFKFVTALLRPRGDREVLERDVANQTVTRLRQLGRTSAAAAFEREYNSLLTDDGSEETSYDDGSEAAIENGGSAEAIEGRRLAMKLRECSTMAR